MNSAASGDRHDGSRHARFAVPALVLFTCCCCGRAKAACGDWLDAHGGVPAAASEYANVDTIPAGNSLLPVERDGVGPVAPVRCDGPMCRRSSPVAPLVPAAPVRVFDQSDRGCRLPEEDGERPELLVDRCGEPALRLPDGCRPTIDRPPCV